jgi:hypothetical protein
VFRHFAHSKRRTRPVRGSVIAATSAIGFRQASHCGGVIAPLDLGELSVMAKAYGKFGHLAVLFRTVASE